MRENVTDIFKEAAVTFASEMAKSLQQINAANRQLSMATTQLVGLIGRYVSERNSTIHDVTSGKEHDITISTPTQRNL